MEVAFQAAGYSLVGPQALNRAAPDEGNMHLLEVVASDGRKEQWLRPPATGEIRSDFSMTEPDGAGSDPVMLASVADQDGIAPMHQSHPAYRYMRDGDGDGIVCE